MIVAGKTFIFNNDLVFEVTEEEEIIWSVIDSTLTIGFTSAFGETHYEDMSVDMGEDLFYENIAVWNYAEGVKWYNDEDRYITFDEDAADITGDWEQFFLANATEEPQPSTGTYLAEAEDLIAVADAIRLKGGTSAPLEWPEGFVTAINNITVLLKQVNSYWDIQKINIITTVEVENNVS